MSDKNLGNMIKSAVKSGMDQLTDAVMEGVSSLKRRGVGEHFEDLMNNAPAQVMEKAGETKKAMQVRMAIRELEHHLNRLYPQIGKRTCDLAATGEKKLLENEELAKMVELASEYATRLKELREHQKEGPPSESPETD